MGKTELGCTRAHNLKEICRFVWEGEVGQSRLGVEWDRRQYVDSLPEYFYPGSLE